MQAHDATEQHKKGAFESTDGADAKRKATMLVINSETHRAKVKIQWNVDQCKGRVSMYSREEHYWALQ